jgi:hypothetical protein
LNSSKYKQFERLRGIVDKHELDYAVVQEMLQIVSLKKLHRKNNYYQERINELIEKLTNENYPSSNK